MLTINFLGQLLAIGAARGVLDSVLAIPAARK